jgi:hypothetical protein
VPAVVVPAVPAPVVPAVPADEVPAVPLLPGGGGALEQPTIMAAATAASAECVISLILLVPFLPLRGNLICLV